MRNSRVVFAAGAAVVLVVLIAIASLSGSERATESPADECLRVWNEDPVAISDGIHAYQVHAYRDTQVVRFDNRGAPLPVAGETGDCGVIFATAARFESEPDYPARVYAGGRWAPLLIERTVPLDEIQRLQQQAVESANAILLPDGTLTGREG